MTIRIQTNDSGINWTEVANLFTSVGWGNRDPHDVRVAFNKSTFACFAFDDSKLVGFGRTIDDGKYYATVVDVVVHPEYQRQSIGRQIMQNLQGCNERLPRNYANGSARSAVVLCKVRLAEAEDGNDAATI
jgi:aralkylamine N-acetyltransferase